MVPPTQPAGPDAGRLALEEHGAPGTPIGAGERSSIERLARASSAREAGQAAALRLPGAPPPRTGEVPEYVDGLLRRRPAGAREERDLAAAALADEHGARERLIEAALPAIVGIARRFAGAGADFADLVQEGCLACLEALLRYEPERGTPFWAYAAPWVHGAMYRLAHDQRRALRLPARGLAELSRLKEAAARLRQESGAEPTLAQSARAAGLELERAEALAGAARPPASLQGPAAEDSAGASLLDAIEDPRSEEAYDRVVAGAASARLAALLGALSARERDVLSRRYGLGRPEQSLAEIGRDLGVTRERARQIEARALAKLRARMAP
jgi:RNA polymerase primary sigma factor